jgi:hypothetical protein
LRRALGLGAALAACASLGASAGARPAQVRVLVATSVSDAALSSMSPALWTKIVTAYVNAQAVPFAGQPTLDDCHHAHAAYMVSARFDLRPSLPGMSGGSGRVAALSRVAVTNCVTGDLSVDETIPLESDPPGADQSGDFDAVPETSWSRVAPQELARYPIFFLRVSHVKSVQPPFAYIDTSGGTFAVGDVVRVFATANGGSRVPILMTVTSTEGKYPQVVFSVVNGTPPPQTGDYVEPVAKARPAATPTPALKPARR